MSKNPADFHSPSNAELRVLEALWDLGPSTVRALATTLYGEPSKVQYRTVQVQLDRLEKKCLVQRERSESPQRFAAAVDRGRFIGAELQSMADKVCEGALGPLLMNLAGNAQLSQAERQALLELLGEGD